MNRECARFARSIREREYPTVNMSPESNVTFNHSHVMHVHVHWSVLLF